MLLSPSESRRRYLESLNICEDKKVNQVLKAMEKYPVEWWLSDEPAEIVRFQMNEPVLLVRFIKLQNALETILGPEKLAGLGKISFKNVRLKEAAFAALSARG